MSSGTIDKIKLALAVLLVVILPFSESLKAICIFALLSLLLLQLHRKEVEIKLSLFHYGFIFLILSALFSSAFAADPDKSLKGLRDIIHFTITLFIFQSISNEKNIRTILWGLYFSTALASLLGLIQMVEDGRAIEIHSLGNQNYTAMYLIMAATSMISAIIFSRDNALYLKIVAGILLSFTLVASVMTAMRTSFVALLLFTVILLASRKRIRTALLLSALLAALVLPAMYLNKYMWEKLFTLTSLRNRFYIWEYAINKMKENPLTGIGLNNFEYTFPLTYLQEAGKTFYDAHSLYMQTAAQMGLPGLISILMIIIGFIYTFTKKIRTTSDFEKGVQYSALGGFLVIFAGGIFDTTLHHENAITFSLFAGLMFGYLSTGKGLVNHGDTQGKK
ncbi:MAG: O-antigen ligase family protein [Nitrospiraceae bacterium]|nr:MAG: O-antigen ligase family protein [Nitrospiraceae bacterium]